MGKITIKEISTQAIRDMKGKSLIELFTLLKPETNEVNKFYNSIIHSVISAIQQTISTDSLMVR